MITYHNQAREDLAGDVSRRREHRQAQVLQEQRHERDGRHEDRRLQTLQLQAQPRLPWRLLLPRQAVKDRACRQALHLSAAVMYCCSAVPAPAPRAPDCQRCSLPLAQHPSHACLSDVEC